MEISQPEAFTINAFCAAFGISRARFYQLKNNGQGPRTFLIGAHTYVSKQAALDWLSALERVPLQERPARITRNRTARR